MCKTDTKSEAKRLRATTFAYAKLEELSGEQKPKVQYSGMAQKVNSHNDISGTNNNSDNLYI